jgi:hypothetical protein
VASGVEVGVSEIHYLGLMDEKGELVKLVPLPSPVVYPDSEPVAIKDVRLNVELEFRRRG